MLARLSMPRAEASSWIMESKVGSEWEIVEPMQRRDSEEVA